jgi:MAF protein
MKKIPLYLASASPARKKLLKIFGVKFRVIPTGAPEKKTPGSLSFAQLAKHNAVVKARAAAVRLDTGIVIAADTIVVQDGRVFGKPQSLPQARRMLKTLSARAQDLYTGIAVIDVDSKKVIQAVEKTRIFMDAMTDEQITAYFSKVSPVDKAGGFDIQGKGAFFIRRIEGCFYNVVGLPVRTLFRILTKMGVSLPGVIIILLGCFAASAGLSGCATEYNVATGEEEKYFYTTDREVAMGESISRAVEKEYKLIDDPLVLERVREIGKKIADVADRRDIKYSFKVLDDDEVNAVSLPGGFVYVNKGLIDRVSNDDELAGVIAHEVGHIVARHSIKKLQAIQGYSALRILLAVAPQSGATGVTADAAFTELLLGYSREDELLADQLGARYTQRAGFDPHGMIMFLTKLQELDRRKPLRPRSYFRTHPYVPDRIRVTRGEIGEAMSYVDYINIQDQPHGY